MALTSTIPASGAILNTGDTITVATDDALGVSSITYVRTGLGGETATIYTDSGGYEPGFTGSYNEAGGIATAVFSRDAGWDSSPFRVDVTTSVTVYSVNYTLATQGQYPVDMQPFNDPAVGDLAVTEGGVAVRSDVAHIDFDDATFDVADGAQGKVIVTGLGGGGSAIAVQDEAEPPMTTDVEKFTFTGAGVNSFLSGTDEVTVNVPAGDTGIDIQDDGSGDFTATTINFDSNISVTQNPPGTALITGTGAEDFTDLNDTPGTYSFGGYTPVIEPISGASLIWEPPAVFSLYEYQASTPPVGGALLMAGGGGTYAGFTSLDVYDADSYSTDLKQIWNNIGVGDHLLIRDVARNSSTGPVPNGVYLVSSVTANSGYTTFGVSNVSSDGSPTLNTQVEVSLASTGSGAGDISGPVSSTNNAIATWDGTGGDALQDNPIATISQANGNISTAGFLSGDQVYTSNEVTYVAVDAPASSVAAPIGKTWVRDESGTPDGSDDRFVFRDGAGNDYVIGSFLVQEEGSPLTPGARPNDHWHTLNFVGGAIEATDGGSGVVDVTVTPGAAPVTDVFGRTGNVVAAVSDYDAVQVDNDPAGSTYATSATVQGAINQLDSALGDLDARESGLGSFIYDDSSLAGAGISTGEIRFNNVTPSSASEIYVADANALGADASFALAGLLNYEISFTRVNGAFLSFAVTAVQDDTTFYTLTVTTRGGVGTVADGDALLLHTIGKPEITYTGDVTNSGSVMSIGTDKVLTTHILDDNVTLAKMDSGTAGALIVYDGSGNPVDIGVGASGEVLTSNASAIPTWESATAPGAHDLAGASHTSTGQAAGKVVQADGANAVEWVTLASSDVGYDNTTSGLTATEVKSAIDELETEKAAATHASTHQDGGADEISVASLSGRLADSQFLSFEEEGTPIGQAHTINFEGLTVSTAIVANEATVTIDPGAVTSIFGRTGAVVAEADDYALAQIGAGTFSQLNAIVADATLVETNDGRLVDNNIALGAWVKGGDTIGTPGAGEFDVNNATIGSITSIRFLANNPNTGDSVVGIVDSMPQAGVVYLQDASASGANSVQFDVTSHILTGGVYWDLTVVFRRQRGTNWDANEYSLQYFPAAEVNGATGTGNIVLETSPTIVTPTIASFTNATHDHADAAGGGTIAYADITGTPTVPTLSKTITVEDPVTAEDISIFFTPVAITITEIRAVVRGTSPSVLWFVKHGINRSAAGAAAVTAGTTTTSESTGSDVTSFDDATIVADSFVWLETTTVSGTNDELSITIVYTED